MESEEHLRALSNATVGASGAATATCTNGAWSLSATTCTTNIVAPASLAATDGTVTGKITATWAAVSGSTGYNLQYRKVGDATWTLAAGASSGWQLTTADESPFEFQVQGKNATGTGPWSATETGHIRKSLDPQFVSQAGVPAKVGVGQSFTFTQIWQNNGAETWTGGAHGTGPHNPADTSVWGAGVSAFPASTATGATATASITVTAPATPGTYPLQRMFQKSGVSYGAASANTDVIVVGPPVCTGVTPNVTTTYNPNGTLTVTLQGASSVESASVKAWGGVGGQDDARDYAMSLGGSTWTASIPVANHYVANETQIHIEAFVANELFTPVSCASASVSFQQLPVPAVTLTPTIGSFTDGGNQGLVVYRETGEFAKIRVDLGAFSSLQAKIEVLDQDGSPIVLPLNSATHGQDYNLSLSSSYRGAATWQTNPAIVKVTYADVDAAAQGKVALLPIAWKNSPVAVQIDAKGTSGLPPSALGETRRGAAEPYAPATHGDLAGSFRIAADQTQLKPFEVIDSNGQWSAPGLAYDQLYSTPLVAVAKVQAPSGVTLLRDFEYVSASFLLPVQAPGQIVATDGTREDDVAINWTAPATGPGIRYRLFRGDTEITPAGGTTALDFIDVPPQRGTIYNYRVKTMINAAASENEARDAGHMPTCRAMRLIGAGLNADMTAINGLVERWGCLRDGTATASMDGPAVAEVGIAGSGNYRSFSVPVPEGLQDGSHVLRLQLTSKDVLAHAERIYEIPFELNRASITVKNLTILYNGTPATEGMEVNSIGRFGIRMDGGSGIGFAEEVK